MPKKAAGENSKKAAGNARKAEAAASKQAAKDRQAEEVESKEWSKGAKSSSKADAAAEKKAEAARKKAEKDALLKEEEASLPSKPKGAGAKKAEKKNAPARGIESAFASLDNPSALNATGIDNALDALSLTSSSKDKIDRHPERRFKAAYTQFEAEKLEEMKDDKSLRRDQKITQIRKEFERSDRNPFNQTSVAYDASKDDIRALQEAERLKKEKRLGSP